MTPGYYLMFSIALFARQYCYAEYETNCSARLSLGDRQSQNDLNETCDDLYYDKQHCNIGNDEMNCLQQRAIMHDFSTCQCHRANTRYESCLFVEVCSFTDPNFVCNKNYKCFENDIGAHNVICKDGLTSYFPHCHRSMVYCSTNNCQDILNLTKQFSKIFKDDCLEKLNLYGNNETVYYIDQIHFNNSSKGYGTIYAIQLAQDDTDNLCRISDKLSAGGEATAWKYIVCTIVAFIVLVSIGFGIWKFRHNQEKEDKMWESKIKKTIDKIIADVEDSFDMGPILYSTEEVDCIPAVGLSLPCARKNDISNFENRTDFGYERLLQSPGEERVRMHSHDNLSYTDVTGTYANSSASSLPGSVWSRTDDEQVVDTDTESGYSGKFVSNSTGESVSSIGYSSPFNCIEISRLDPIIETESMRDDDSKSSEISNLLGNMENERGLSEDGDHNRELFFNLKQMNNPTYIG